MSGFLLLGILIAGATPAVAYDPDNLVPNGYTYAPCQNQTLNTSSIVCQTDNGGVSVYITSSVSVAMEDRVRATLDGSYDPISGISIAYVTTPSYSGSSETDIVYQQGSMPAPNLAGVYWCDDAVDGYLYKCDQGYVRFVTSTTYERRALTCHETGHAFGLLHGSQADPFTG